MYSVSKKTVRINSGVASLKEVQDMKMYTRIPIVLARTLSSRCEGFERTLSSCQIKALVIVKKAPHIKS